MLKTLTKIIAVLAAAYLLLDITFLRGLYAGHNIGAVSFGAICYPVSSSGFCPSHADPYFDLGRFLSYISLFLMAFIAGQLIKHKGASHAISFLSILVVLLGFIYVYTFKSNYLLDDNKYIDLMRMTITEDLIHIWLSAAILAYQTINVLQYLFYRKDKKIGAEEFE